MTEPKRTRKSSLPQIVRLQLKVRRAQLAAILAFESYSRYYAAHPKEHHHVHEKFL